MMGIDPSAITDDTDCDKVFFPLTQKLDEVFHAIYTTIMATMSLLNLNLSLIIMKKY